MNIQFKGPFVISKSDYNNNNGEKRQIDVLVENPADVRIKAGCKDPQSVYEKNPVYYIEVTNKLGNSLTKLEKTSKPLSKECYNDNDPVIDMQSNIKDKVTKAITDPTPVDFNLNTILDRYA